MAQQPANISGWGDVRHCNSVITHFLDFYLDCHLLNLRKWINSDVLRMISWSLKKSWPRQYLLEIKIWYWSIKAAWSSDGWKRIFHTGDQYRCFPMCAVSWFATISHTLVCQYPFSFVSLCRFLFRFFLTLPWPVIWSIRIKQIWICLPKIFQLHKICVSIIN